MDEQETREAFQRYLDAARYKNETSREKEIHKEINRLQAEMREKYLERAQPLIDELVKINERKPPAPVMGDDGRIYVYTGPRYWEEPPETDA